MSPRASSTLAFFRFGGTADGVGAPGEVARDGLVGVSSLAVESPPSSSSSSSGEVVDRLKYGEFFIYFYS